MSEEERAGYKEIGKTQLQHKAEKWNKALKQVRAVISKQNTLVAKQNETKSED